MIYQGDCLEVLKTLPGESVDCCVTSPPYFNLRDYQVEGQIGLEDSPEEYVEKLVTVFGEVRRVLKDRGTCWIVIGDSYAAKRGYQVPDSKYKDVGNSRGMKASDYGLKPKDLIGIPWMVAFALRADGWYLRGDYIWAKPAPMPESVTDRCVKSHEYIFHFSKKAKYYFDHIAIEEDSVSDHKSGNGFKRSARVSYQNQDGSARGNEDQWGEVGGKRNKRSVWAINTKPFKEAHFATFPPEIPAICIKAGTSEKGVCPACGAPWVRQLEKSHVKPVDYAGKSSTQDKQFSSRRISANTRARRLAGGEHDNPFPAAKTIGWRPSCSCILDCAWGGPIPATVLDPFFGAGTTGVVSRKLLRNYIGIELNGDYIKIAKTRLAKIPAPLTMFAGGD